MWSLDREGIGDNGRYRERDEDEPQAQERRRRMHGSEIHFLLEFWSCFFLEDGITCSFAKISFYARLCCLHVKIPS